jgi:DDE superfamily endonuclease.
VILVGIKHQSIWYSIISKEKAYRLSTSENGWTTDDIGFDWLQEVFEPYTKSRTAGRYRLLILDGHHSHAIPQFDRFCKDRSIILLYMPPYSSHLLQPLDVSCFGPLKQFYGQKTQEMMHNGVDTIDKMDFLSIYSSIHQRAFSAANISSGFTVTGLVPLNPEKVISKLKIKLKNTYTTYFIKQQSIILLREDPFKSLSIESTKRTASRASRSNLLFIDCRAGSWKVIKGCEITMQNAVLLQQENRRLRIENQLQKKNKEAPRYFSQDKGSLTIEEVLQR